MCTSLHQERLGRRSQAATLWQPVWDPALDAKTSIFNEDWARKASFLLLLILQIRIGHLLCASHDFRAMDKIDKNLSFCGANVSKVGFLK